MAGKLGLVAKLVLGTTVLAGGGAGTWYVSNDGLPFGAGSPELAADTQASAQEPTGTDLDAIESAWAAPPATSTNAKPESSAVAHSAETTRAGMESQPAPAPSRDRYATAEAAPEAAVEESSSEPEAADPIENSLAKTDTAVEQGANPPSPEPAVAEESGSKAEQPVARGQEPNEDAELQALTGEVASGELQSLSAADEKGQLNTPAAQSRNALRDSAVQPAGDRYGNSAAANNAAPDGASPAAANPFAAGGKSTAGAPQPAPANQATEPLPGGSEAGLSELPATASLPPLGGKTEVDQTAEPALIGDVPSARSMTPRTASPATGFGASPMASDPSTNISQAGDAGPEGAGRPGEKALEGPQKPSLEIQKFAPGEIQVGKPAKFVVRVRNIGSQAAEGVAIQDQIPHGTKLIGTTPEAQQAGGALVWNLGKLSPGEDRTVEMQLMPVTEGEIGSVATVSYSAQASVKARCTMPQLAIRMTAPAKVMVGQEQRVKIELRNPGSGDATGVMLFENVPQNVKHAAGPALEFEIGTLRAGETRELELVLLAEKPGKTVNVLSARAEGNLQVQQQVEFEVIAPSLTVDVAGPERRYLERPATYEVSVENPGTAPAHDVRIVTKLPKGLRFVRANNMGEYDPATHAVYWSLAELPEGEKGTVELVAMPVEAGPQTLEVESRAGQGLADQAQRQIMIDGLAAIMFEVKDLHDPIEVGGETGYEIRVMNQGTKAATRVQVGVTLPPGMKLVSAEGETPHAEQRGAVVFEPLGQLAPKADTVYRIRAQGTAAGDQRVVVEVKTDDLDQPIRREESTLIYGDE